MSREIKFRGIAIEGEDKGKFVHGSYVYDDVREKHIICSFDTEVEGCELYDSYGTLVPVDIVTRVNKDTVGQYTGLEDKNGIEIYEGDVLKQVKKSAREGCESSSYDKNNFEVVFKYGSFWLQRPYGDSVYIRNFPNTDEFVGFECFEVIGNIYENPELLEV